MRATTNRLEPIIRDLLDCSLIHIHCPVGSSQNFQPHIAAARARTRLFAPWQQSGNLCSWRWVSVFFPFVRGNWQEIGSVQSVFICTGCWLFVRAKQLYAVNKYFSIDNIIYFLWLFDSQNSRDNQKTAQ